MIKILTLTLFKKTYLIIYCFYFVSTFNLNIVKDKNLKNENKQVRYVLKKDYKKKNQESIYIKEKKLEWLLPKARRILKLNQKKEKS